MKVIHRVAVHPRANKKACTELAGIGIDLHNISIRGVVQGGWFEIGEVDPKWADAKKIIARYDLPAMTEKRFTEEEVRSAEWVQVRADYMWGYPMPADEMGYRSVSFDPARECPECGSGQTQVAPLRLAGEPSWRGRAFLGIYWIQGLHARPDVVECMREQGLSGFDVGPILNHKTGQPLRTVVQLRFPHEIGHGLIDSNLERDNPRCGHVKYIGASQEMYRFRADSLDGCPDFAQAAQWFGAMHLAVKVVLASQVFANLYLDRSWKGLRLEPVELV